MIIINKLADVRRLESQGVLAGSLATHLERKVRTLRNALAPDVSEEDFNLDVHGNIGLLEPEDRDLSQIGLPKLSMVMPEWVSRMELAGKIYYILYVMADNDCVLQVYLPDPILEASVRSWLSEQPVEEELAGGYADDAASEPF